MARPSLAVWARPLAKVPPNGVYVLFEMGEEGHGGERIVRIGTHTGQNNLAPRIREHLAPVSTVRHYSPVWAASILYDIAKTAQAGAVKLPGLLAVARHSGVRSFLASDTARRTRSYSALKRTGQSHALGNEYF